MSTKRSLFCLLSGVLTAKYIHQVWQQEWDEAVIVPNKLHEILAKLVGALSPVNHKGLHRGWTQASLHLQVILFTSDHTTSHVFWAYWYSVGTQHGNLLPAEWPILFCGPTQEPCVSHSQHRRNRERFGKWRYVTVHLTVFFFFCTSDLVSRQLEAFEIKKSFKVLFWSLPVCMLEEMCFWNGLAPLKRQDFSFHLIIIVTFVTTK